VTDRKNLEGHKTQDGCAVQESSIIIDCMHSFWVRKKTGLRIIVCVEKIGRNYAFLGNEQTVTASSTKGDIWSQEETT